MIAEQPFIFIFLRKEIEGQMKMADIYKGMLVGNEDVFQLALDGKARKYALGNIFILGIIYGFSNLLGALQTTPELPLDDKFAFITPLIFSTAGIVTICGALIACTMVYWAASKAFGGHGGFGLVFDLIGLAAIPFWILAPLLNYTLRYQTGEFARMILIVCMALAFFWAFRLVRMSMIQGQGLNNRRATIAVAAIWIFSVSSIYVFLP